jgi:hypothetical protein
MSSSISWRLRLMKRKLVVRIPPPPLMWTCQKKKKTPFIHTLSLIVFFFGFVPYFNHIQSEKFVDKLVIKQLPIYI